MHIQKIVLLLCALLIASAGHPVLADDNVPAGPKATQARNYTLFVRIYYNGDRAGARKWADTLLTIFDDPEVRARQIRGELADASQLYRDTPGPLKITDQIGEKVWEIINIPLEGAVVAPQINLYADSMDRRGHWKSERTLGELGYRISVIRGSKAARITPDELKAFILEKMPNI